MSRFLALAEAAPIFGFKSGPSLLKAFRRRNLPPDFLVRIGERGLRVDVERLEAWLRGQVISGSSAERVGR